MMSVKKVILWIVMLVFIDQIIKLVVNNYFLETGFVIVPSLFEFRPVFNGKGPYVFHLLSVNISLIIVSVFYIAMLGFVSVLYNKIRRAKNNTMLLDYAFIFYTAGIICGIISFTLWEKGCLDYIYLKPLFVFDLKDLYIDCFACLIIVFLHKYKTLKSLVKLTKIHE
jgi:hypothetical protein